MRLDYFLWRFVKPYAYADKPEINDHLDANNQRSIFEIHPNSLQSVRKLDLNAIKVPIE